MGKYPNHRRRVRVRGRKATQRGADVQWIERRRRPRAAKALESSLGVIHEARRGTKCASELGRTTVRAHVGCTQREHASFESIRARRRPGPRARRFESAREREHLALARLRTRAPTSTIDRTHVEYPERFRGSEKIPVEDARGRSRARPARRRDGSTRERERDEKRPRHARAHRRERAMRRRVHARNEVTEIDVPNASRASPCVHLRASSGSRTRLVALSRDSPENTPPLARRIRAITTSFHRARDRPRPRSRSIIDPPSVVASASRSVVHVGDPQDAHQELNLIDEIHPGTVLRHHPHQ